MIFEITIFLKSVQFKAISKNPDQLAEVSAEVSAEVFAEVSASFAEVSASFAEVSAVHSQKLPRFMKIVKKSKDCGRSLYLNDTDSLKFF